MNIKSDVINDEYYCSECNNPVKESDLFCSKCGADLHDEIIENEKSHNNSINNEKAIFFEKNKVGIIVFILFMLYDLLRTKFNFFLSIPGLIIDIPLGILIAIILQLIYKAILKLFK